MLSHALNDPIAFTALFCGLGGFASLVFGFWCHRHAVVSQASSWGRWAERSAVAGLVLTLLSLMGPAVMGTIAHPL